MEKSLYNIYKTFFKVGTLLLGGGYVILPLLQSELVEKKGWINNDELCEYYAISQSLPGLIAANVSIFVGHRIRKTAGAIAAITGMITSPFLSIILIAKILEEIIKLDFIKGIFWGVGIGVLVLIYQAIKELWNKSIVDKFSFGIFLIVFLLSVCLKISPAILVLFAVLTGLLLQAFKDFRRNKEKEDKE